MLVRDPLCEPCKAEGKVVKAHRLGPTPMCDAHYRMPLCAGCKEQKKPWPATVRVNGLDLCKRHAASAAGGSANSIESPEISAKETKMAKRIDERIKAQILKDAAGGMNTNAIATKHSVGWITVANIVKAGGGGAPKRKAAAGNGRRMKSAGRASARNGDVPTLIATAELCDGIWNALPLEKKAELLNKLPEI